MTRRIGIVSPGAMGGPIGRSLAVGGADVVVALAGRSERSRRRAAAWRLDDVRDLEALVSASDVVLSVVPPAVALEVASDIAAALGSTGVQLTVVDANAISPARAREVARAIIAAGSRYVDGGIVGGPPAPGGRTDLLLSGDGADDLAAALTTDELVATAIGVDPTAASALKMCYAAWSKGTTALLISIRAVAQRAGIDDALVDLWGRNQPAVLARSNGAGSVAGRAWRWVDEMAEIARTFEDAGVPGGAASAAKLLYERLASFKDIDGAPSIDQLVATVLERGPDNR
ncbi:MAG: DUF1932 domain-containing protein [Acidimicrobiales bacterium]